MSPPAWVELAQQTGDPRYAEFALAEFWATTDFLYDPVEKLYFRDSRFFERRDDQGRKQFWSRGNGWVFAGIANMLESLPKDNPHRPRIEQLFRDMAVSSRRVQKPDGYWPPSLLGAGEFAARNQRHGLLCLRSRLGRQARAARCGRIPARHRQGLGGVDARGREGRPARLGAAGQRPARKRAAGDTQYYGVGAFLLAASAVASLEK